MKATITVTDDQGNAYEGAATLEPVTGGKKHRSPKPQPTPSSATPAEQSFNVVKVAERINDSDQYAQIDAHVLSKHKPLLRIMLCLYAVKDDASPYLSTTDMEKLTNQLNVRVFANNMGKVINEHLRYFTAEGIRAGRGTRTRYKLNRQGLAAFERVLKGEAL